MIASIISDAFGVFSVKVLMNGDHPCSVTVHKDYDTNDGYHRLSVKLWKEDQKLSSFYYIILVFSTQLRAHSHYGHIDYIFLYYQTLLISLMKS